MVHTRLPPPLASLILAFHCLLGLGLGGGVRAVCGHAKRRRRAGGGPPLAVPSLLAAASFAACLLATPHCAVHAHRFGVITLRSRRVEIVDALRSARMA